MTDVDETADETPIAPVASRRNILLGAGALGAVGVLAACGSDNSGTPSGGNAGAGAPSISTSPGGGSAAGAIKAADIPVGGGTIFPDAKVVITQPSAGDFKAFSAVCTHMGCLVASVQGGKIGCPCHQSEFNIADGSVARGPATRPLPPMTVTTSGGNLTVA